jgi:hypothetical protein
MTSDVRFIPPPIDRHGRYGRRVHCSDPASRSSENTDVAEGIALLLRLRWANLLVVGETGAEFLAQLMPSLASPVAFFNGATPECSQAGGTLIIRDVDRLSRSQQDTLCEWLSTKGRPPYIIAISDRSLFSSVRQGAFSEQLYYRLNTVLVDLEGDLRSRGGSVGNISKEDDE